MLEMMKQLKEEELDGVQWSELGIFWRDQKSEEADKRAFECFKHPRCQTRRSGSGPAE